MEIAILEFTLLYAVLIPATVTILITVVAPARFFSVAMSAGFLAGWVSIQGWPHLPPAESIHWLAWIAVALAFLSVLGKAPGRNAWRLRGAYSVLTLLTLFLLLRPAIQFSWKPLEAALWITAFLMGALVFWTGLSYGRSQKETPGAVTILLLTTAAHSLMIALSGSVVISQLAAAQSSVTGAILLIALWRRQGPSLRRVIPTQIVLLTGLIAAGWYFVEVPGKCALLMMVTPWAGRAIPESILASRPAWHRTAAALFLSLLPILLALYFAASSAPPLELGY